MSIDNENELEFQEGETNEEQPQIESSTEESEELAEYTPNYSYKVKDEEYEFDEDIRGLITSKEIEDKVRDLYTKSAGLDGYKSKLSEVESQTQALVSGYQHLKELRDSNDVRGIAKVLNISEDALIDAVAGILDERELPEEQRKLLEENRKMREKMESFENELNGFKQQEGSRKIEDDIRELESLITSESYKPVADAMKSVGLNMADEVVAFGHLEFVKTGREPSVASVVKNISDKYSYLIKQAQDMQQDKPVIPSVKGSNATNVGTKVTSIDDLRKLAMSKF